MCIKLTAVYTQNKFGYWTGRIKSLPYIHVLDAEDLETAKVFLRIIAAEEMIVKYNKNNIRWDITKEEISYFKLDDDLRYSTLKTLL